MKLEVRDGTFGYGPRMILKDINFTLDEHKVMTILGPNGVGKTTLLKCIMGFLKWKSGMNLLNDKPVGSYTDGDFWKVTSYVPQAKQSVFSYKVVDSVLMGLNARQNFFAIPSKEDYDKAHSILEELGVAQLAGKFCNELSGGELQMVMIARALISEPELMILDEPESNLDMKNQLRVIDTIEQIAKRYQTSCLINTHFPDHALKISDRTLMLGANDRKLLGDTKDIVTEDNIKNYFNVRSKIVSFSVGRRSYRTIFPYKIAE